MAEKPFTRTALHYGSLSGIAVFLFYILLYFSGLNIFGGASMLGIWIPVIFLVLAIRFQRNSQGGVITFRQGFIVGLLTSVFSAILFGLAFYLFGTLYATNLLDFYKEQAVESLEAGKPFLSEKLLDQALESIDLVTMSSLAFSEALNKIVGGVIATLVIAAVFRRKPIITDNL